MQLGGAQNILQFIYDIIEQLSFRPQCRHKGDYHDGNLIVDAKGSIKVIDWHTIDFENIGDLWYELNRLHIRHKAFAAGQIEAILVLIPNLLWRLCSFYLTASAITSIVRTKYYALEELYRVLALNKSVLRDTKDFTNMIPEWY